jgi:LPXTG-site transpeptidase (sortase) family protein
MVENTAKDTSTGLENGTIHLLGTATPGTTGNVFITGHSSNYIWAPGHYKSVFALLDKLSVGDIIYLKYQNKTYAYKVYEQKIIKSNDTSVLEQSQKSTLTLMTCAPVGTSINRLIIKSNQIYPDPKSNISSNSSQTTNTLPGVR